MKKLFLLSLCVLALFSCRGRDGRDGRDGANGALTMRVAEVNIPQWDYTTFSDNNYFYGWCEVPALTSFVFSGGDVNAYVYMTENGEKIQHSLPYVLHIEEVNDQGQAYFYTRTIDFVYGIGWVQFEVRDSDFEYEVNTQINPDPMDFRIVLTY